MRISYITRNCAELLLIQVLILINLVYLPLTANASGQDPIPSSSESPQEQRVTISMSYSSTNFKAGPVNRRGNNSHNIINPNRRHSPVSPVNRSNFKNSNSSRFTSLSSPTKGGKARPRQALFLPDLALNKSPSNAQVTDNEATTIKPTMHPLRVLQTEISLPTKPIQRAKPKPKHLSNVIVIKSNQDNLSNHRMNADDKPTLIASTDSKSIIEQNGDLNLTSDITAQLELINQRATRSRITPNEVLTMSDKKGVNDTDDTQPSVIILSEGRSDLSAIFSGESKPEIGTVEGRSASENIEQVKLKKSKVTGGVESKQRSSGHFNYINTLEDQIAEEDNQYEVTELVNQYPAEYENQDQGSEPPTSQTPNEQGAPQSAEFQSQIQNPNHNYLNVKPNFKGGKTRPKLHSYYDQNYHLMDSSQPTNQGLQYEYRNHESKNQPHKDPHYYANTNDHGNFHGNHGFESHYVKPGFGPFWHHPLHQQQLIRPEPSLGQEKYPAPQHQHYNPSPSKHNHPPPQPYKGEHDLQTASTDTIMDRFEVFYKEYKILTWATLFVATSLGFLAILVFSLKFWSRKLTRMLLHGNGGGNLTAPKSCKLFCF
ncbi:unnamed protein product, partial [Allacma fusca]